MKFELLDDCIKLIHQIGSIKLISLELDLAMERADESSILQKLDINNFYDVKEQYITHLIHLYSTTLSL